MLSIRGHLENVYDEIVRSVEAHFNKGLNDKKYFVHDVNITSCAETNYFFRCVIINTTRFIVRIFDGSIREDTKYITCIISMGDSGSLSIENIYYSDDGSPVEGFTK